MIRRTMKYLAILIYGMLIWALIALANSLQGGCVTNANTSYGASRERINSPDSTPTVMLRLLTQAKRIMTNDTPHFVSIEHPLDEVSRSEPQSATTGCLFKAKIWDYSILCARTRLMVSYYPDMLYKLRKRQFSRPKRTRFKNSMVYLGESQNLEGASLRSFLLFGKEYSSDNAGDGPHDNDSFKTQKFVLPTLQEIAEAHKHSQQRYYTVRQPVEFLHPKKDQELSALQQCEGQKQFAFPMMRDIVIRQPTFPRLQEYQGIPSIFAPKQLKDAEKQLSFPPTRTTEHSYSYVARPFEIVTSTENLSMQNVFEPLTHDITVVTEPISIRLKKILCARASTPKKKRISARTKDRIRKKRQEDGVLLVVVQLRVAISRTGSCSSPFGETESCDYDKD